MTHIKLPVSMSKHLDVVDADGYIILQTLSYSPTNVAKIAAETIRVLNAYDDLVAQRDALADACKALMTADDIPKSDITAFWPAFVRATELAMVALGDHALTEVTE